MIQEQKADKLEEELEDIKEKLIEEENKVEVGNNGCMFIVFKHIFQAQEAIRKSTDFLDGVKDQG